MPKKKKTKKTPRLALGRPPGALSGRERAGQILEGVSGEDAVERARARAERAPTNAAMQAAAAQAFVDAHRLMEAIPFSRRAVELTPRDPFLRRQLALLYGSVGMPMHAARALGLSPESEPAAEPAPAAAQELEQLVREDALRAINNVAAQLNLSREDAAEAHYWMQESWLLVGLGKFPEGLAAAERALAIAPHNVPALNNRAEALASLGQREEAIAALRHVVEELDPNNTFALASLIRRSLFARRPAEAQAYAERLRRVEPASPPDRAHIARGLSWVEDDEGVFNALRDREEHTPETWFLLAVAATNLGRREEALATWRDARAAGYNTPDIIAAIGKLREGKPVRLHYHRLDEVVTREELNRLGKLMSSRPEGHPKAAAALEELLADRERWLYAGELALRNPLTEEFGVMLLAQVHTPEAVEILRRFVSGKEGSEQVRMLAGQTLVRLGALAPTEAVPFWRDGEFRPVSFQVWELVDMPEKMPAKARALAGRVSDWMQQRRWGDALAAVLDLIRRFPDVAAFYNDLATIYSALDREEDAIQTRKRALEVDPEDLRARLGLAHLAMDQGDVVAAREWAAPLGKRTRMRPSECFSWMILQVRLALAEEDTEQARRALDIAGSIAPNHPLVEDFARRLELLESLPELERRTSDFVERLQQRRFKAYERQRAQITERHPSLERVLATMTKERMVDIARQTWFQGASALRRDQLRLRMAEYLRDDWPPVELVRQWPEGTRVAVRWVLEAGGSVPLAAFAERYGQDIEVAPQWYYPETLLNRLRASLVLVDVLVEGEPVLTIPVELREPLRARLDEVSAA